MAENDDGDYVGYGSPPKHTRFPKGKSGNLKGRPKGAKNLKTIVLEELSERVPIRENGRQRKISKMALIVKTQVKRAVEGSDRAATDVLKLAQSLGMDTGPAEEEALQDEDMALLEDFRRRVVEDAGAQKPSEMASRKKKK